jgi:hypothetical protein
MKTKWINIVACRPVTRQRPRNTHLSTATTPREGGIVGNVAYVRSPCRKTSLEVKSVVSKSDRLCGLVARVPGYRSREPGLDYLRYQIFWEVVVLERDPLSLVRLTEELLEWKSSGFDCRKSRLTTIEIRCADHATPSICNDWHQLRRQSTVYLSV